MILVSVCAETIRPGQNLTAVEENALVYQVNPVSRMNGEERAVFLWTWGPDFVQKGVGKGGAAQFARGTCKSFLWRKRGGVWRGGRREGGRAIGCIHVGVYYTHGARNRRWCGWWERRGRLGRGVVANCSSGMGGSKTIMRRYPGRGSDYYAGVFRY